MKNYDPTMSFDAESARLHDVRGDEEAAVAFLWDRSEGGPVLELAIGTGRLALPLAARGVQVDGIDLSEAMVARLREKPGGRALEIVIGDFAEVSMPGRYRMIYLVWNTLYNLLTQEAQLRCFENVARHLLPGGQFVVEGYTPGAFHRLEGDQDLATEAIATDRVALSALRHLPSQQRIEQSHITLSADGVRVVPVVQRYVWPSEMDLMARMAGLERVERYADWTAASFDDESAMHVSVYRLPSPAGE